MADAVADSESEEQFVTRVCNQIDNIYISYVSGSITQSEHLVQVLTSASTQLTEIALISPEQSIAAMRNHAEMQISVLLAGMDKTRLTTKTDEAEPIGQSVTDSFVPTLESQLFCANCGSRLAGQFCHQCGTTGLPSSGLRAANVPATSELQQFEKASRWRLALLITIAIVLVGAALGALWLSFGSHSKKPRNNVLTGPGAAINSRLSIAVQDEQAYWTMNQAFSYTPSVMGGVDASINWVTRFSTSPRNEVLVTRDMNTAGVILTTGGVGGRCYSVDAIHTSGFINLYYEASTDSVNSGACSSPPLPESAPPEGSSTARSPGRWSLNW
jgi:hypothetical protein